MQRVPWADLPLGLRNLIESQTGSVLEAESASEGRNSELAAFLTTSAGKVFIKGLRSDHLRVWTQQREAMVNPYVIDIAPRLLWHVEAEGWNVLGFEHVAGRHADYSPGSPDLLKVIDAMRRLGEIGCPDLPLKRSEQRWAGYVDGPSTLELLRGDTLLHTDYKPMNILVGDAARIVDWAWPTRGAGWIDPACFALRLMAAGHAPSEAEAWAARVPAWAAAPREAVDTFAIVSLRMWDEIATDDPQPWKAQMRAMVQEWVAYRDLQACPTPLGRFRLLDQRRADHGRDRADARAPEDEGQLPLQPRPQLLAGLGQCLLPSARRRARTNQFGERVPLWSRLAQAADDGGQRVLLGSEDRRRSQAVDQR
jgi:hypothetical protein